MTQPKALRLEDVPRIMDNANAELRRLRAENEALRKAAEAASCSNTFGCRCPKHFVAQQSEQRPKRVLTAVWRDRAQRAEAQCDALLDALQDLCDTLGECGMTEKARAAIRARSKE